VLAGICVGRRSAPCSFYYGGDNSSFERSAIVGNPPRRTTAIMADSDPGKAHAEGIKAVEAAAIPIAEPNHARATLRSVLGTLKARQVDLAATLVHCFNTGAIRGKS
jgi:hypothetical protein